MIAQLLAAEEATAAAALAAAATRVDELLQQQQQQQHLALVANAQQPMQVEAVANAQQPVQVEAPLRDPGAPPPEPRSRSPSRQPERSDVNDAGELMPAAVGITRHRLNDRHNASVERLYSNQLRDDGYTTAIGPPRRRYWGQAVMRVGLRIRHWRTKEGGTLVGMPDPPFSTHMLIEQDIGLVEWRQVRAYEDMEGRWLTMPYHREEGGQVGYSGAHVP